MSPGPSARLSSCQKARAVQVRASRRATAMGTRSEEHTSELQSLRHLVCRLLLEKKKKSTRNKSVGRDQTTKDKTVEKTQVGAHRSDVGTRDDRDESTKVSSRSSRETCASERTSC